MRRDTNRITAQGRWILIGVSESLHIYSVPGTCVEVEGPKRGRPEESFLDGQGGGPRRGVPPPRTPRGRLGRPWRRPLLRGRRPLLRGRRARITAYLQWILSTGASPEGPGASEEGPLKLGLGASAEIRRSRLTAYLQRLVAPQRIREQNHCIFTASREKVSRSKGRSEDTDWKNEIDTLFWALHIYSGS